MLKQLYPSIKTKMKYIGLLLTVIIACLTFCKAAVVQVTDENFADLVGKDDEWLLDL